MRKSLELVYLVIYLLDIIELGLKVISVFYAVAIKKINASAISKYNTIWKMKAGHGTNISSIKHGGETTAQ